MNQLPEDDMLRQFFKDSKKPAPHSFSDFVMQNLPQQVPLPEALKKPLLSPWALAALAAMLVLIVYLFNNYSGEVSKSPAWALNLQSALSGSVGQLINSPATLTIMAVLSVAVMLLTGLDRLLKRFMEKTH